MYFQARSLSSKLQPLNLCHAKPDAYRYALISTAQSLTNPNSRYSIFFAYPQASVSLDHQFSLHYEGFDNVDSSGSFLDALDSLWKQSSIDVSQQDNLHQGSALPFTGGWFVYLGYELAQEIEPSLNLPKPDETLPVATAVRCPAAIIVDHQANSCTAVVENDYSYLLDTIEQDIADCANLELPVEMVSARTIEEAESEIYFQQVNRIKQYIYDGDIFQANLSRPWQVNLNEVSDIALFNALAINNPAGFAAYARLNGASIISSSPERLVSCRLGKVETRPIAGTRPRVSSLQSDNELADELMAHPKERAEHIMLIDLERNDLGRICIPGTMQVNELMVLESYQHVHHIVSNIQGRIQDKVSPADIIHAVFPGGTITGCPKVRCMQILADLEQQARGAYTGSVGYINRDGSLDLNILIRTMVRHDDHVSFRAGGGIVADSNPGHELEETRAKARGLLNAFSGDQQ